MDSSREVCVFCMRQGITAPAPSAREPTVEVTEAPQQPAVPAGPLHHPINALQGIGWLMQVGATLAGLFVAGLFLYVVVGATFFSPKEEEHPGNPAVYARIESMTDCAALQREFDTAYENHQRESARGAERLEYMKAATGYMNAADKRMRELGCYGK